MDTKLGAGVFSAPDYLDSAALRAVQTRRLVRIVRHAYDNVELFRTRMNAAGLSPDSVTSLEDLAKLPFTVKTDLRDTYPFGLFAVPMKDVVRLHTSSGTTGKPIVVAYTKDDLDVWISAVARALSCCGLSGRDIIQITYGYGLFTGGLGVHYGAEAIGATVVPAGTGNTERQAMLLRDFGVTAICSTPNFFIHLVEKAAACGIDVKSLPLRIGIFGAEPWTDGLRQHIQERAGIEAFDIYGLSEITGPGVAVECPCHRGLHIMEDLFYPEIIDPETGKVLPDGEEGELVLTTLCKYAMPMIRYRTRDITRLIPERCACGRTLRRMERVERRSDDMIIVGGVNVFPSQIESALLRVVQSPQYMIRVYRAGHLDRLELQVE
ncbi:MAG: phenylacetate--CoA ligase, partial [Victivallaceae bacterium]|nr:phenylacetate--CoA ligase [Victivallaceae bacterium]